MYPRGQLLYSPRNTTLKSYTLQFMCRWLPWCVRLLSPSGSLMSQNFNCTLTVQNMNFDRMQKQNKKESNERSAPSYFRLPFDFAYFVFLCILHSAEAHILSCQKCIVKLGTFYFCIKYSHKYPISKIRSRNSAANVLLCILLFSIKIFTRIISMKP